MPLQYLKHKTFIVSLCFGNPSLVIELHRLRLHQLCGDDRVAFNIRSSSFMIEILASFVLLAEVLEIYVLEDIIKELDNC